MVLRGRRINNFVDFSLKSCSVAAGIWLLTLIFHKSAKGWPPQPLKERLPNITAILGFQWSIPQMEAVQVAEAKKTTQYLNRLHFWYFWVQGGCWGNRGCRGHHGWWSQWGHWSHPLGNLNLICNAVDRIILIWWFENINFLGRIMEFEVRFWYPSNLRLWRIGCVIYVKNDWWNSNAHCCSTCL